MKAKNILMTLLLAVGAIAAKASGFPPELALVSQPVMVYNHSSITVYYDVENIGDYTYRGCVSLFLDPDYGYSYAEKYVKVRPGRIKRIAMNIPLRLIDRRYTFTIMPYYELGDELYSFTTFEYFDPIRFYWDGPRTDHWVVITVPPRIRYYNRPGSYRYYYDGFRPPMPPAGHELRPMDPMHHTYAYHHNNGVYPANHFNEGHGNHINEGTTPPAPAASNNNVAPNASVRPNANTSSMSASSSSGNSTPSASNSVSSSSSTRPSSASRPSASTSATTRPSSSASSSSSASRPSSSTSSNVSRPSSSSSSATTRPSGSSSSSSSVGRPSGSSNTSSTRPSSTSSSTRSSSSSSNVGRSSSSSSSTATRTSSTASTSSSSRSASSSSSRGSASTGRR